jgi:hypothetical protein
MFSIGANKKVNTKSSRAGKGSMATTGGRAPLYSFLGDMG